MNKILIILSFVILASCGVSQEEKTNIAAVTCSIMGETRNMDAAVRVREMNDAREKIGGEPFLRGDYAIQEAFEWGLCQELVLNVTYDETLKSLKDAKRESKRIAAEKLAKEKKIAEEHLATAKKKLALQEEEELKRRYSYVESCVSATQDCKAALVEVGEQVYSTYCSGCHQTGGEGISGVFPSIINNSIVVNKSKYLKVLLNGVKGTAMQSFHDELTPIDLASVATYTMYSFGNSVEIDQMILPKDIPSK
jgi:mono/diheme cytochrome c family protein